jgi:hypothetical protein
VFAAIMDTDKQERNAKEAETAGLLQIENYETNPSAALVRTTKHPVSII